MTKRSVLVSLAVIAVIAGAISYQPLRLRYLFDNGKYEDFLKEAPPDSEFGPKRMIALEKLRIAGCARDIPALKEQLSALLKSGQHEAMKNAGAQRCAPYDAEIAKMLEEAPLAAAKERRQAVYESLGGREMALRKGSDLIKQQKPHETLRLLEPLRDFEDRDVDQLIQTAAELATKEIQADATKQLKKTGVSLGMTKAEVLERSWGKPNHINRTVTASGVREQWVYDDRGYLYFENDLLVAIQN